MSQATAMLLFKMLLTGGLGLWLALAWLNSVIAFTGGVASIGRLMQMQLLDQEPRIQTPLQSRRVAGTGWHRAVYIFVLALELLAALLLLYAAIAFAVAVASGSAIDEAVLRANLACAVLLLWVFVLLLGGTWFAYHLRQEGTQITHFVLIAVALGAFLVVNLPVPVG